MIKTVLQRSTPLQFERLDGKKYVVPPITRGQIRRCIELDPVDDKKETHPEADERRAKQIAILLERCPEFPLDDLTSTEEAEIIYAIMAAHQGIDPTDVIAIDRMLKKKAVIERALTVLQLLTKTPSPLPSTGDAQ